MTLPRGFLSAPPGLLRQGLLRQGSLSHSRPLTAGLWAAVLCVGSLAACTPAVAAEWSVEPASVTLPGNFERVQLLVRETLPAGQPATRAQDFTPVAKYVSENPQVATVSPQGNIQAVGNGTTVVRVEVEGVVKPIAVEVTGVVDTPAVGFTQQVLPILSKAGCNGGACHASQHGKGGFTLSVMGYDPPADRNAIVRDRMQRRINLLDPGASLLLRKPLLDVPHGGGRRLAAGSNDHRILQAWIAAGAPEPQATAPRIDRLLVTPSDRVGPVGLKQQLRVVAIDTAGVSRDVTAWARFDSMDEAVVTVTPAGVVTAVGRGQAPVMVRFEGQAQIAQVVIPFAESVDLANWQSLNFVDELAAAKFRELGIAPVGLCDDATFIRRAFLDAVGSLPSRDEVQAFLASPDPDKRHKLVDRLLGFDPADSRYNDRYAAWWALKWADLIRNSSRQLGDQGMWALHNWLKESFRTNKPFDQFVRELVTAKGSIFSHGPANYFRIASTAPDLAEATAQLFLGTRLACAKCHHHPFEKYSQADYYGFAAFFSRVAVKNSAEFGNFGGESVVWVRGAGEVTHPKTGKVLPPTPLDGEPVDHPLDRRLALADWLTSRDNVGFSRNVVNRAMAALLGRGLVDPVDDMRATNPPSNPALMNALVDDFRANGFNLKHLLRRIMHSRLYQLDSQPTPENAADTRFYSHYRVKRISAEALLDAVDQATGSPTKFPNLPVGTRAIELPDSNYPNPFLVTFGKPLRASVCECERSPDENLAQALHTLNGDVIATKIADAKGRVATLVNDKKTPAEIVTELYLAALCREPTSDERQFGEGYLAGAPSLAEGAQDLLWGLLNSKQFLFVR